MDSATNETRTLAQLRSAAENRGKAAAALESANERFTEAALTAVKSNVSRYQISRISGLTWGAINKRLRKEGWKPPEQN